MKAKAAIIIVLGVIVLGILTAVLLSKNNSKPVADNITAPSSSSALQSTQSNSSLAGSSSSSAPYPVVDINALISIFPTATSTQQQKADFNNKVSAVAVDSGSLDINGCNPQPTVMLVHLNKAFTLVNKDSSTHSITHNQFTLTAGPNSSQQVSPSFQGQGAYGYRCDGQLKGILYVTQ